MAAWDNEEIFKFIQAYQSEEAIWNFKIDLYKDKVKVRDAWNRISDTMGIPVPELKRKKESLMTTFRIHMRRKRASLANASGDDEIYHPSWLFYDAMELFLADVYDCPSHARNINLKTDKESFTAEDASDTEGAYDAEDVSESDTDPLAIEKKFTMVQLQQSNQNSHQSNPKPHHRSSHRPELQKPHQSSHQSELQKSNQSLHRLDLQEANKHMKFACTAISSVLSRQRNEEDECELFGKLVAKKLKKLHEDDRQEIMLEIDTLLLNRSRNTQIQYDYA